MQLVILFILGLLNVSSPPESQLIADESCFLKYAYMELEVEDQSKFTESDKKKQYFTRAGRAADTTLLYIDSICNGKLLKREILQFAPRFKEVIRYSYHADRFLSKEVTEHYIGGQVSTVDSTMYTYTDKRNAAFTSPEIVQWAVNEFIESKHYAFNLPQSGKTAKVTLELQNTVDTTFINVTMVTSSKRHNFANFKVYSGEDRMVYFERVENSFKIKVDFATPAITKIQYNLSNSLQSVESYSKKRYDYIYSAMGDMLGRDEIYLFPNGEKVVTTQIYSYRK